MSYGANAIGSGWAVGVLMGMKGSSFTWKLFLFEAFFNAIPGILLQLLFIPGLMLALGRTGMVPMHRHSRAAEAPERN